jgi:hypothetical protein
MAKDTRRLLKALARQGFTTHPTRRGHTAVKRNGITIAVLAGTPSDWRASRNALAQLRRAGFVATS